MLRCLFVAAIALEFVANPASAEDKGKKKGKVDAFAQMDTNKDGFISLEEFKARPGKKLAKNPERAFKAMDTNKDGQISREELKAALEKLKKAAKK